MIKNSGLPTPRVGSKNSGPSATKLWIHEINKLANRESNPVAAPSQPTKSYDFPESQSQASSTTYHSFPIRILETSAILPQNEPYQQPGPSGPQGPVVVHTGNVPQPVTSYQIQDPIEIKHPYSENNLLRLKFKIPSTSSIYLKEKNLPEHSNTDSTNDSIQAKRTYPSNNQQQKIPQIPKEKAQLPNKVLNEPLPKRSRPETDVQLTSLKLKNSNSNGNQGEKPGKRQFKLSVKDFVRKLFLNPDADIFDCQTCHRQFDTLEKLKNHFYFHGLKLQYPCNVCGNVFFFLKLLHDHIHLHQFGPPVCCTVCKVDFDLEFKRDNHMKNNRNEDPDNPLKCSICYNVYELQADLESHFQVAHHKSQTVIPCIMCDTNFLDIQSLNHHLMKHHNFNNYKKLNVWCNLCGKGCSSQVELEHHHLNIHANDEPKESSIFACIDCPESFPTEELLNEHKCQIDVEIKEQPHVDCTNVFLGTEDIEEASEDGNPREAVHGSRDCKHCLELRKKDNQETIGTMPGLDDMQILKRKFEAIAEECFDLNTLFNYQLLAARILNSELGVKYLEMERLQVEKAMTLTSNLMGRINSMEAKIMSILPKHRAVREQLLGNNIKLTSFPDESRNGPLTFAKLQKKKNLIVREIDNNKINLDDYCQSVQQTPEYGSQRDNNVSHAMNLTLEFYVQKALPKN